MRILLVEDYGPLRLSVAQTLREEGFTVDDTADGEEEEVELTAMLRSSLGT